MDFLKRFRFQVVLRIILLFLSLIACILFLLPTGLIATIFVALLIILFQVYALIRFVESTNLHLSRFMLAVKHGDFATSFRDGELGPSFNELTGAFNEVMEKLRLTRSEKEEQHRYLQTVVHHVGIGLIAFLPDGAVDLVNTAAKRLLKVAVLKNIHSLESFSPELVRTLRSLRPGEKALVKIGEDIELALHAAEFRLKNQLYTLVSLQNIQSELQEKEMEAWQKLIRVLTHEIMNSMTPITSMTATVLDLLNGLPTPGNDRIEVSVDAETIGDITAALNTIHKRSQGLTEFVNAYRNLTLIPNPNFKVFAIDELFARVEKLMENRLAETGIVFHWSVEPQTLELTADPILMEQVLINLMINAVDALKDTTGPRIDLTAEMSETGKVVVRVNDNGPGIEKEALAKVFIPFFSTKKKGSGIGLSLSRQIMKLHNGSMTVHSEPNIETVFTLTF